MLLLIAKIPGLIYLEDDSIKNSLKEDSGRRYYKVKTMALDNVLIETGIDNADLIKIDVEGAEYKF